jgi:hypothetical protein
MVFRSRREGELALVALYSSMFAAFDWRADSSSTESGPFLTALGRLSMCRATPHMRASTVVQGAPVLFCEQTCLCHTDPTCLPVGWCMSFTPRLLLRDNETPSVALTSFRPVVDATPRWVSKPAGEPSLSPSEAARD